MSKVRALYLKAGTSEAFCHDLLYMARRFNENDDALMMGYEGAAMMIMAKFLFNPVKKLSSFRRGQSMLEKAIGTKAGSVELRFIRYSVQQKSPKFLGYNRDLAEDRARLVSYLRSGGDTTLQKMIRDFLSAESR